MPSLVRSAIVLGALALAVAQASWLAARGLSPVVTPLDSAVHFVTVFPPGPVNMRIGDKMTFSASLSGGPGLSDRQGHLVVGECTRRNCGSDRRRDGRFRGHDFHHRDLEGGHRHLRRWSSRLAAASTGASASEINREQRIARLSAALAGTDPRHHKKKSPPAPNRLRGTEIEMGLGRVELPTSRLSGVRSNHLSYRPLRAFRRIEKASGSR